MPWARGSTRRWRELRAAILRRDPTCQLRYAGCTSASTHADHILNVAERPDLEWEPANLQGVCAECHRAKTHREAAAGRTRRRQAGRAVHPGLISPDA